MALPTKEQEEREAVRREKVLAEYMSTPEYTALMQQRVELLDAGTRSLEARAFILRLCEREDNPAEGCIFFIENFGWTFNPKMEPKHFPFILFDFQKDEIRRVVDAIINGHDILIEKSREMGVTWIVFAFIPLWFWLFRDGSSFLVGSYKEILVDDRTDGSIFGKIDYAIQSLPKWILPEKFDSKKHRNKLKLINPVNNNLIGGDTMNPYFGRGMRKTAILFDELGFWDYAKEAWESSGDSSNCRIANSTPHGYNYYALLGDTDIEKITLHWKLHPLKDEEWYRYECARRTDEEIAQELDISYSKSREGKVYPEWNEENVKKIKIDYNPGLPLYVSWDFGKTDDTAIIWAQRNYDGKLNIIDTYKKSGKNIDFFVPFINGYRISNEEHYSQEEEQIIDEHKEWKKATHFGDPAGRFQNQVTDQSVIDVLKDYGIVINYREDWKNFTSKRKSAAKRLIGEGIFLDKNPRTKDFDISMLNSSYPKIKVEGIDIVRSEKPKHDGYSHYRTAFEYLALGLEGIPGKRSRIFDKFKPNSLQEGKRRKSISY